MQPWLMYPNLDDERDRKTQYASPAANDQGPCIESEKRQPEIRLFSQAYT